MKLILKNLLLLTTVIAVSGCASVGRMSGGQSFKLREYKEVTLENGLKVILIPEKQLPFFSMVMMVKTGASADPSDKVGLANFTASLIDKGTRTKTTTQLADDLGQLGSRFSYDVDQDYTVFRVGSLAQDQDTLINIFSDIMTGPSFPQNEIARQKDHLKSKIKSVADEPSEVASLGFNQFLFGSHPYGRNDFGTVRTLNRIKKADIIRFYISRYRPNNAILAITGQYDEKALIAKLNEAFKPWISRDQVDTKLAATPNVDKQTIQIVEKSDLKQTQIRIGHEGITRTDPDFLNLRVASTILGGAFSSRLMNEVRVRRGLTYGIYSSFAAKKERGAFTVTTFTRNDKVGEAVGTTLRVIQDFIDKGVTETEVLSAKQLIKGQFPQAIQTPEALAENLLILRFYGISDDYLSNFFKNIDRISTADVNKAIKAKFKPEKYKILVHAPRKEAEEQLKGFGPIEFKKPSDFL